MFKLSLIAVLIASYAAAQGSPGLRGAAGGPLGETAVEMFDAASTSDSRGGAGAKVKSRAAVAAMARDPPEDAYEYTDGEEETPPPVLFANPVGEDYFVRGFDGDKSYQWDDEWDDDAPSDE